jgi:type IV secretory pathway TraG/TraD family ATPase VirD4
LQFGQKNISTLQRNLLNKDEILRISAKQLLAILRGNLPLLLDKMIYKEHPLAEKLKDSSIYDYNPEWTKNNSISNDKAPVKKEVSKENKKKQKLSFDNF